MDGVGVAAVTRKDRAIVFLFACVFISAILGVQLLADMLRVKYYLWIAGMLK